MAEAHSLRSLVAQSLSPLELGQRECIPLCQISMLSERQEHFTEMRLLSLMCEPGAVLQYSSVQTYFCCLKSPLSQISAVFYGVASLERRGSLQL